MGWQTRRTRLRTGVTLSYLEQGDRAGTPVVLVHSFASTAREFEPMFPHLSPVIHACAPTFHGHDGAVPPAAGYAVADLSDELAAFMDAAGLASAVIVGTSSGGYIAQWFAGDHPARTRGLVLVGSPARFRDKPAFTGMRETILALADPIDPDFARQFGGEATFPQLSPDYLDEMLAESARIPAAVWKATYLGLWDAPEPGARARIVAPTLILWGDRDHFLPRGEVEDLRNALPGSRLVVYEGVGHLVLWEEPARVAAHLIDFVAGLADG